MRNFVDFTVEQINDFQTTLMRGDAEANSRYWSYEAQIWCTTRSICHQIEADCLTDDSYRLFHEDAIDWVKTQIEKVGKAVINNDDFADEFRDLGYTTVLIHKKDSDGIPYEYILIYEPEEGEEPRDEEWDRNHDPEPISICYGDPITLKMNQCSLSREKTNADNWTSYRCPTAWLNVPNNISSEDIYHDLAVCGFIGIAAETLKNCICFGVYMDKEDDEWNDIQNIFESTWNLCQR